MEKEGQADARILRDVLEDLRLGTGQHYENMVVIPLFGAQPEGPEYLTLAPALAQGQLTITEASESGSVPELRVVNKGDLPILLIDGEELVGAKQNRVLNTSILLEPDAETVIPVSCTEQGRWAYTSLHFADSGVVMDRRTRARKVRSVSHSLTRVSHLPS